MFKVMKPGEMNETFAAAVNSRNIENLLALYEPGAVLMTDGLDSKCTGKDEIAAALRKLLDIPGRMVSKNNFCIEHGDLALLRADYGFVQEDGSWEVSGSSAEIVRKQADGSWLYVVDHATGASLPRII